MRVGESRTGVELSRRDLNFELVRGHDSVGFARLRTLEPRVQRAELCDELSERCVALLGVAPVSVKRGLGAAAQRDGNTRLLGDGFNRQLCERCADANDLSSCMTA